MLSEPDAVTALDVVAPPRQLSDLGGAVVRDAVAWRGDRILDRGMLVLVDDALWAWDGQLGYSPINDVIDTSQLRVMAARSGDLWLATAAELSLWRDGWLHSITVAGSVAAPPFAVAPALDGRPVLWAASEAGLVGITSQGELSGAPWTVADFRAGVTPRAVAVDGSGAVWAVAEGLVHRRDPGGAWKVFQLPDPAQLVAANPSADRAWVRTDGAVYTHDDGEFALVKGAPLGSEPWEVDDAGRLLLRDEGGLRRVSVGRPVAVVGVPGDGLLISATEVYIAPTAAADVIALGASLGGDALALESEVAGVWKAALDPLALQAGAYDLDIEVQYADGSELGQWTLIVADPTWSDDILPLFRERCAICHDGNTGSAVLDTPEAWEVRFDDLVARVERNNMPLGQMPLTDFQKGTIRAWGAKGFPR